MGAPDYQEHAPHPALRAYINCYWSARADEGQPTAHLVLPDGCVDLLYSSSSQSSSLDCIGTMRRAQWVQGFGPVLHLGVRFRPGGAAALLGTCLDALTDGTVEAETLIGYGARQLHDELAAAPTLRQRITALEDLLLRRRQAWPEVDPRIVRAAQSLEGGGAVEPLAAELGLSRQHLRRLFLSHTGLTPKMFARVSRLGRAVEALRTGTGIAQVAGDAGFSDQAHLNREFKQLTGERPTKFTPGKGLAA